MAELIPDQSAISIGQDAEITQEADQPSRTFKVNWNTNRIEGMTDGREAIEQAIYKILQTERFEYLIYSWNYGFELNEVLGESMPVVEAEIARLIEEALTADARIESVTNFAIQRGAKRDILVSFEAVTKYGAVPYEQVVNMGV